MNFRATLLAWLGVLSPLFAADWRESLSPPKTGAFPPLPPLRAQYRFGWGAIPAARAEFDFSRTKQGEQRLVMTTATSGAVRALWRLDARHEAYCRPATLRPLRLEQSETYSDESHRVRVTFDAAGVSRLRESKPAKGKARTKRFECPDVFDLQTSLLFVRSQTLRTGESHSFVVYPATDAYLARVQVVGRERISVAGRAWPAVKLDVKLHTLDRQLELGPHRKFRKASVWVSDDRARILLKAQAEVFVGSVWAELERVDFPRR